MKKRYLSIILILVILVTTLFGCGAPSGTEPTLQPGSSPGSSQAPSPTASPEPQNDAHLLGIKDMALTVCAMSDVHMGDNNTEESFTRAMRFMKEANVSPDAYIFAGDITNTTASSLSSVQVEKFKSIYEQFASPSQMVYCLGPSHDVPHSEDTEAAQKVFTDTFGQEYYSGNLETEEARAQGVRWTKIKGYNFFTLDWNSKSGTGAPSNIILRWLRSTLQAETEADPNKPIFVAVHVPDISTVNAVLRRFPQVICFTGHVHNSVAREDSISQDNNFTNIHCGGQNYYRVNGYERFNENPFLDLGDIYAFGQAVYLQVDYNNNVTITRVDTYNGKIIGEKWEIGPDKREVYTKDRIETVEKCLFQEDAVLDIKEIGGNQLVISFDACKTGGAGPALYYQIQIYAPNARGKYVVKDHKEIASQQVFYPNDEGIPSLHYSYTFSDLDCLDNYAVVVTAKDCWNTSGNALIYTNGTYESKIPAGGKVNFVKRELTDEEKLTGIVTQGIQNVAFTYDKGQGGTSTFKDGYSMAVRFYPTYSFTNIKLRCSSWGDTTGTLDFALYKWKGSYDDTVAGEAIGTYRLTGYKGSTVYTVFDGTYDAGEYLVVITTPNPSEGVGLYHWGLSGEEAHAYISYENKTVMSTHIYLEWENKATCTKPYKPYES